MVKGVNRQILEINDTGNRYFERVLLFVAPGKCDIPEAELQAQARHYVSSIAPESGRVSLRKGHQTRAKRKKLLFWSISGGTLLTAAGIILFNIL